MNIAFGPLLRKLRIERGLSQTRLAEMVAVTQSSVANWEAGRRVPNAVMLSSLSECLGVDAGELFRVCQEAAEPPSVILVDDEKIILNGGVAVLKEALPGAAVSGFLRATDAVAFAVEHPVAAAFLDIEMGTVSGLDLCGRLLKINPRTNVFFLTGHPEYALNAWDTGACGFDVKPITVESVRKQVARMRYPVRGLL